MFLKFPPILIESNCWLSQGVKRKHDSSLTSVLLPSNKKVRYELTDILKNSF